MTGPIELCYLHSYALCALSQCTMLPQGLAGTVIGCGRGYIPTVWSRGNATTAVVMEGNEQWRVQRLK